MNLDLRIEPSISLNEAHTLEFVKNLGALSEAIALVAFKLIQQDTDWKYVFEAVDGRKWIQILTVHADGAYSMTFNQIQGAWHLDEFVSHRKLRDTVVHLIHMHNVTKIVATWS